MFALLIAPVVCCARNVTSELALTTPRSRAQRDKSRYGEYMEYVEIPVDSALSNLTAIVRHCRSVGKWVDWSGVGLASGFANDRVGGLEATFQLRRVDPRYYSSGWVWYLVEILAFTTTFERAVFTPRPTSGDEAREQCLQSLHLDSSPGCSAPLLSDQTNSRRVDDDLVVSRRVYRTRDGRHWVDTRSGLSADESHLTTAQVVARWTRTQCASHRDTSMTVVAEVDPVHFSYSEGMVCGRLTSLCACYIEGVACETTTVRRRVGSADVLNVLHVFAVTLTLSPTSGSASSAVTERAVHALVRCLRTFLPYKLAPSYVTVSIPTAPSSHDAVYPCSERSERSCRSVDPSVSHSRSSRTGRTASQMRVWLASMWIWTLALACAFWGWEKVPRPVTVMRRCEPTPGHRFVRVGSRLRSRWTRRLPPKATEGDDGAPVGEAFRRSRMLWHPRFGAVAWSKARDIRSGTRGGSQDFA